MIERSSDVSFKILVVEDSLLDFELMQSAIRAQVPCTLKLVTSEKQYATALSQETPDLIISDSNITTFDGMAALKLAHEKCPGVPFLFCSGSAAPAKMENARRAGAGWVVKEGDFATLAATVKRFRNFKVID